MSGRVNRGLAGGSSGPRQAPAAGQRWEVVYTPPPLDRMRRIVMDVEPWWGRSTGKKPPGVRARVFTDGKDIYLSLESWQTYGINQYRRQIASWYRLLPDQQ